MINTIKRDDYDNILKKVYNFVKQKIETEADDLSCLVDYINCITENFLIEILAQQYYDSTTNEFQGNLVNIKGIRFALNVIFNYDLTNYVEKNKEKYNIRKNGGNRCLHKSDYPESLMYCIENNLKEITKDEVWKKNERIFGDIPLASNKFNKFLTDDSLYGNICDLYSKIDGEDINNFFSFVHFNHIFKNNSILKIALEIEKSGYDSRYVIDIFSLMDKIYILSSIVDYSVEGKFFEVVLEYMFDEKETDRIETIIDIINLIKEKTIYYYFQNFEEENVREINEFKVDISIGLEEYLISRKNVFLRNRVNENTLSNNKIYNFLCWAILRYEYIKNPYVLKKFSYINEEGKITTINDGVERKKSERYIYDDKHVDIYSSVYNEYLSIYSQNERVIGFIKNPFRIAFNENFELIKRIDMGLSIDEYQILFPLYQFDKKCSNYKIEFLNKDERNLISFNQYFSWIPKKISK